VMLAPEERYCIEALAIAEHVSGRSLSQSLGDDKVLDTDAVAGMRVRPPRDVARGENARRAGLEILVDDDPAIDGQSGFLRKTDHWPHADAEDKEVGGDRRAVLQCRLPVLEPLNGLA